MRLHFLSSKEPLDPTCVKDIIVTSEDTRIAMRISELTNDVIDEALLEYQSAQIRNSRFNLRSGQQCVRDFFLCLNQNLISWPDVFSMFAFDIKNISECTSCRVRYEFETNQLFIEFPVPPNNSSLNQYVENFFHERTKYFLFCDGDCQSLREKTKWTSITNSNEAKFLIVILTRGIKTMDGYSLVPNKTISTENLKIRYCHRYK